VASEGVSTLDRLAEMDRLLHDVQAELAPDREPAPPMPGGDAPPAAEDEVRPGAPDDAPPTTPNHPPPTSSYDAPDFSSSASQKRGVEALSELATSLLAAIRELLDGYDQVLARARSTPSARAIPRPRRRAAALDHDPGVTMSAGPFPTTEAVREFEDVLSRLPRVRDVAVRGYEGTDRAIIEVRLDPAST
jgi:hypothetical protein